MIHGSCGNLNLKNVCMKNDGKYKNHYPKSFCTKIILGENSYPKYMKCNNGKKN